MLLLVGILTLSLSHTHRGVGFHAELYIYIHTLLQRKQNIGLVLCRTIQAIQKALKDQLKNVVDRACWGLFSVFWSKFVQQVKTFCSVTWKNVSLDASVIFFKALWGICYFCGFGNMFCMLVVCHKYIIVIGYLSFILFWASFRSLEFGYQWYTLVFSIGDVFVSDDALLFSLSKSRQNSTLISQKVSTILEKVHQDDFFTCTSILPKQPGKKLIPSIVIHTE